MNTILPIIVQYARVITVQYTELAETVASMKNPESICDWGS